MEPGKPDNKSTASIVFKVYVPASSIFLAPGEEKLSFDIIAIPLSDKGTPVDKESRGVKLDIAPAITQQSLAKGWNLIDAVANAKSVAAVKVVIGDNSTGRIGSVIFPVAGPSAVAELVICPRPRLEAGAIREPARCYSDSSNLQPS